MELLEARNLFRKSTRELIVLKADSHKLLHCDGISKKISRDGTSEDLAI